MAGILMVGLGSIGQRHLRNLRALLGPGAEIGAYRVLRTAPLLTDKLQVETGSELEEKYNLKSWASLDAALASKPELVFICNPSSLHIPIALEAAKAGCHLFIEKPLSHSLAGIAELRTIVQDQGLIAMVAYQMRFHPCLKLVKSLLEDGRIGRVLSADAQIGSFMPGWHAYEDYRMGYAARSDLGGGAVLTQIHEIDFLGWFFGAPVRVFALGGHLSTLQINVEDVAESLLECHVDGRLVPVRLHQDYLQRPSTRNLRIVGDKGKIDMDLERLSVTVFDEDGNVSLFEEFQELERNQLFLEELKHFLGCVERGKKPLISIEDGASSLATALAIKQSMANGETVLL